jgi:hypothetical protein
MRTTCIEGIKLCTLQGSKEGIAKMGMRKEMQRGRNGLAKGRKGANALYRTLSP